jgi:hypothetical protein
VTRHSLLILAWLLLLLPSGLALPRCLCAADCPERTLPCCPGEDSEPDGGGCCEQECLLELENGSSPATTPQDLRWSVPLVPAPLALWCAPRRSPERPCLAVLRAPRLPPGVQRSPVLLI